MASPSRSGSVARNTWSAPSAAFFSSPSAFSLLGMTWYSGVKSWSTSMPILLLGRSFTWPTDAFTA